LEGKGVIRYNKGGTEMGSESEDEKMLENVLENMEKYRRTISFGQDVHKNQRAIYRLHKINGAIDLIQDILKSV
jgi:hypothetical protein